MIRYTIIIMRKYLLPLIAAAMSASAANMQDTINLAGLWRFQLDPMGFGKTPGSEMYLSKLTETITLPGSTDEGGKGVKNTAQHVDRLSRKYEYSGPAWYQREVVIPESWGDKRIVLELERCHWETTVYVDGREAGIDERLSTPNRFTLTDCLTPGPHMLTICVDNRMKYPMDQWAHGTTEYTQTNWNGIVGDIQLVAGAKTGIDDLQIYPDIDNNRAIIKVRLHETSGAAGELSLKITAPDGREAGAAKRAFSMPADSLGLTVEIDMGKDVMLWNEFTPNLYTLTAIVEAGGEPADSLSERFGMRKVEQGTNHVKINGTDVHLRGVLDCCVFPLTGYPSTDAADWEKIFSTIKEYGFNHVRFHSWCPPEAAFEAADQLGLYLQVELPMWIKDVGKYPARRDFFEQEMYAILDEYGNHPSFALYCNGNENEGDFAVLEDLIVKGKAHDPRHLYSASTARTHVKADQFYASHVSPKGWITVYEGKPGTDWDVNATSDIDVPVIAHETGQRCMYPNFSEMSKYTGVLEPRNMSVFRERLAKNGMLAQADDFLSATGAHTVLQYKEVNEALLRSDKSGGYQLLGLQDFPGQGSAYVGILDAFWESKGLVTPEKYRESNGPVVVLARMPKRIYDDSENFAAAVGIYNFGPEAIRPGKAAWKITDADGKTVKSGTLRHGRISNASVDSIARVEVELAGLKTPAKYTFGVDVAGKYHNEWDLWVYDRDDASAASQPYITRDWNEARKRLSEGKTVMLMPDSVAGRRTHFASHFWNPIMFNWNPMIVGTLINDKSHAFDSFPTANYADWQWTDVLNNATAIDLTDIEDLTPVVQSIDTYEVNRKLGVAFEVATPEGGRLFVLSVDPEKDIESRPASRRLINSVADYVGSDKFRPAVTVALYELDRIFDKSRISAAGNKSSEAVKQLLNQ